MKAISVNVTVRLGHSQWYPRRYRRSYFEVLCVKACFTLRKTAVKDIFFICLNQLFLYTTKILEFVLHLLKKELYLCVITLLFGSRGIQKTF